MTASARGVPAFHKGFLDFLRDEEVGAAALSPKRFGEAFSMDLQTLAAQALAPYKRIRRLEFSDLPKTISGKIRRVELRKAEGRGPALRGALECFEEDFPELKG